MDRYIKIRSLGSGTFGAVFLVKEMGTSRQYALKEIRLDEKNKHRTKDAVLKEAQILSRLKHPNIVAYKDSFFDDTEQNLYIVQDYCDGGTLDEKISASSKKEEFYSEKQIMQWFVQILMAVHYIHSQKILHRDLKTQNVFMNRKGNTCKLGLCLITIERVNSFNPNYALERALEHIYFVGFKNKELIKIGCVCVGDFGISKVMSTTIDLASTCVGTPSYFAPEMCQDLPYSSKADIWALGCILYELSALQSPFQATNLVSLIYKIVKSPPDPIPSFYNPELAELITMLLTKKPEKRPSAQQILNLAFVKSVLSEFIDGGQKSSSTTAASAATAATSTAANNTAAADSSATVSGKKGKLVQCDSTKNVNNSTSNHSEAPVTRTPLRGKFGMVHPTNATENIRRPPRLLPSLTQNDQVHTVLGKTWDALPTKNKDVTEDSDVQGSDTGPDVEYEDDFEQDDDDDNDDDDDDDNFISDIKGAQKKKQSEYCDDFEDFSSDEEFDSVLVHARKVHGNDWNFLDDVTIVDEDFVGPIDIRKLLSPEAAKHLTGSTSNPTTPRWSIGAANKESCFLVEDLLDD